MGTWHCIQKECYNTFSNHLIAKYTKGVLFGQLISQGWILPWIFNWECLLGVGEYFEGSTKAGGIQNQCWSIAWPLLETFEGSMPWEWWNDTVIFETTSLSAKVNFSGFPATDKWVLSCFLVETNHVCCFGLTRPHEPIKCCLVGWLCQHREGRLPASVFSLPCQAVLLTQTPCQRPFILGKCCLKKN